MSLYQSSYRTAGERTDGGIYHCFCPRPQGGNSEPFETAVLVLVGILMHADADSQTILLVLLVATFHLCEQMASKSNSVLSLSSFLYISNK
jgi:hypothetical protein